MSASLHEMENYLKGMNCNPETVMHLGLLADYNATLYDPVSHNLNYGIEVVKQKTPNPTLDFSSVEGRDAATGLLTRLRLRNAGVSDYMQIKAPLMETFKQVVDGEIATDEIIPSIDEAINKSLTDWADKSFDL